MQSLDDIFGDHRVMVILRGMPSPQAAVEAAHRAWDAGVELVEVPIGQDTEVECLAAVVDAGRARGKVVGAGTIISTGRVRDAHAAGAQYTVAPGFDPAILAYSEESGMPHLPGVATPSEVQHAWSSGCKWVKVYPACTLGPSWLKSVRRPFADMKWLVTGGVTTHEANNYIGAGANIVAFGASVIAPPQWNSLVSLVKSLDSQR